MKCTYCGEEKASSEFYTRSDKKGLRSQCKACLRFQARVAKLNAELPVKWPPTHLNWLTPITPYNPDQECSILEQPLGQRKVYARNVIVDPESTAEDDG